MQTSNVTVLFRSKRYGKWQEITVSVNTGSERDREIITREIENETKGPVHELRLK